MPKRKIETELYSYGIYESWDKGSKELPKLKAITTEIPVIPGIEFGYVIKIKRAKGKKIQFIIDHPPFNDENGNVMPSFEGEEYIASNEWSFFLGDTVWEPYEDKEGLWKLTIILENQTIAVKDFRLYLENKEKFKQG